GLLVEDAAGAAQVLTELCADRSKLAPLAGKARAERHPTVADNARRLAEVHAMLGPRRPGALRISPGQIAALNEHRRQPKRPNVGSQAPPPSYAAAWWYRYAERAARLVPARARSAGLEWLVRRSTLAKVLGPVNGSTETQRLENLKLVARGWRANRYLAV